MEEEVWDKTQTLQLHTEWHLNISLSALVGSHRHTVFSDTVHSSAPRQEDVG